MPNYSVDNAMAEYSTLVQSVDNAPNGNNAEYNRALEKIKLARLYAEVKNDNNSRNFLSWIIHPVDTYNSNKLLTSIENRFTSVHNVPSSQYGDMYTKGVTPPKPDRFNVNKNKFSGIGQPPMSQDEIYAKYGANADRVWDNPSSDQELTDRFGDDFWNMDEDDVINQYGDSIYEKREEYLTKWYDDRNAEREQNYNKFFSKEKNLDDELLIKLNNSNLISEENEDEVEHEIESTSPQINIVNEEIKEPENDDIEIAPKLDNDWVNDQLDDFNNILNARQKTSLKKMLHSGNFPEIIDLVETQNIETYGEIFDEYEKKQQEKDKNFQLKKPKSIADVTYEAKFEPYQHGRIKQDDEKRLFDCANIIANLKEVHENRPRGFSILHPITYFNEWNNLRKMNNALVEKGFTQQSIDRQVNECLTIIRDEVTLDDNVESLQNNTIDPELNNLLSKNLMSDTRTNDLIINNNGEVSKTNAPNDLEENFMKDSIKIDI